MKDRTRTNEIDIDKEIETYLRSLSICPFCRGEKLTEGEIGYSPAIVCKDCGFRVSLSHLKFYSRFDEVNQGMKTMSEMLQEALQEIVERYERRLRINIVRLTLWLEVLKKRLLLGWSKRELLKPMEELATHLPYFKFR